MKMLKTKINGKNTKIAVYEPGDKVETPQGQAQLDDLDWENNSPPVGYLWARKLDDISPVPKMIMTKSPELLQPGEAIEWVPNPAYTRIEGMREVVGIIHIVTRDFLPITKAQSFLTNVRDKIVLELLYKALCVPPPFYVRMWEKIKGWFKK